MADKTKTIAIFNVKGGVGKTTSATTIAHLLATEHNKRVLLVDLDPQSNTTSLFGENQNDILEIIKGVFLNNDLSVLKCFDNTVGELLIHPELDITDSIYPTRYPRLDLLPAFLDLAEVEEKMKADIKTPQQFRLKSHLAKIQGVYDYIILDLSPSINLININGLAVTDYVFTPLRCDQWGFAGYCIAQNLIKTVSSYNPAIQNISGCFFVQFDGRSSLSKQVRDLMAQILGSRYIDIPIRKCVKVEEMTWEHKALADYAGKSTAAQDYKALTTYILENY